MDEILATVAVKEPEVCPAEIIRLRGTAALPLLLDRVRLAPPDGAGADKVTVKLAEPGAMTVLGEQFKDAGRTVTVRLRVADCCRLPTMAVRLAF